MIIGAYRILTEGRIAILSPLVAPNIFVRPGPGLVRGFFWQTRDILIEFNFFCTAHPCTTTTDL